MCPARWISCPPWGHRIGDAWKERHRLLDDEQQSPSSGGRRRRQARHRPDLLTASSEAAKSNQTESAAKNPRNQPKQAVSRARQATAPAVCSHRGAVLAGSVGLQVRNVQKLCRLPLCLLRPAVVPLRRGDLAVAGEPLHHRDVGAGVE